jgi:hypothetical protein
LRARERLKEIFSIYDDLPAADAHPVIGELCEIS